MTQIFDLGDIIKIVNGPDTKTCQKPYKFHLEVKVQGRIWIKIVRDTSSRDETPMCQIWLSNVKRNKNYGPDTKTCQ